MEDCNPEISGTYRVYLFADAFGNTAYAVAEQGSETIQACGLRDTKGNPIYFESEAYHAPVWCDDHGVQYRVVDREFTLPLRGE